MDLVGARQVAGAMSAQDIVVLLVVAGASGWIDAVVGGGGLVQLPALLMVFPGLPVATAVGTNTLSSVAGVSTAAVTYARRTKLDLGVLVPAACIAIAFSAFGATCASKVPAQYFRPGVLAVLLLVAVLVTFRPTLGKFEGEQQPSRARKFGAILLSGCVIGFYDGVLGPGAGTFLVIGFVATLGVDFLHGSAASKVVNTGTNLSALVVFAVHGQVLWALGLGMAAFGVIGGRIGAKMVLRRGTTFVRMALLVVVASLIVKMSIDQFV